MLDNLFISTERKYYIHVCYNVEIAFLLFHPDAINHIAGVLCDKKFNFSTKTQLSSKPANRTSILLDWKRKSKPPAGVAALPELCQLVHVNLIFQTLCQAFSLRLRNFVCKISI